MHSSRRIACLRLLAGFAAATVLFVVAAPIGAEPASAARADADLVARERSHDFGRVDQGAMLRHRFELRNHSEHAITIHAVEPQCTCTTIDEWPRTLAAGESGIIAVTVDTTRFAGPITKAVHVVSGASTITVLEVRADVWTPIAVSTSVVLFPAVTDPTQSATRVVTLRNQRSTPVRLGPVRSSNPHFKAALREITPGMNFELTLETVPPLPDGTQSGQISVATSDPSFRTVKIEATVTVLPAVQVVPQAFTFGAARLIAPETRFVVVLNRRRQNLRVTEVTTNAPGVSLVTTASPDQKQITVTATFPAGFEPARGLWIRGKTSDPTVPTFEVPIVPTTSR